MKNAALWVVLLFAAWGTSPGTTHIITNVGFTFSPSLLTVEEGDTVIFSLEFSHNAREVSQADWNAGNATALGGGFDLPNGGGTVVMSGVGTHYYVCVPHVSLGMKGRIVVNPLTGVEEPGDRVPAGYSLGQNYPNPFNPATTFQISVGRSSFTEIAVYSGAGKKVRTLVSGTLAPGTYVYSWDGMDDRGHRAASDAYFVRMVSGEGKGLFNATRKILLLK